ncbi:hypothetical protein ACN42_g11273, partial [Penicillium freii]
NASEKK